MNQIIQISQVKAAIEIAELLDEDIDVTDEQIEQEMEYRIRYYTSQIGSQEKLEQYFNKTMKAPLNSILNDCTFYGTDRANVTDDLRPCLHFPKIDVPEPYDLNNDKHVDVVGHTAYAVEFRLMAHGIAMNIGI